MGMMQRKHSDFGVQRPRRRLNLSGQKYGALTAMYYIRSDGNHSIWLCLCDCGRTIEVRLNNLRTQHTKSCGCFKRETNLRSDNKYRTHGHTSGGRTPTYQSWRCMIERCRDESNASYPAYGGRGICVCARRQSFQTFLEDMGERPRGHTLDRIDPEQGYSPENCRWADWSTQNRNKRGRHGRKVL